MNMFGGLTGVRSRVTCVYEHFRQRDGSLLATVVSRTVFNPSLTVHADEVLFDYGDGRYRVQKRADLQSKPFKKNTLLKDKS